MQEPISIPPFLVDVAAGVVYRHGREIRLRRKTFALLRYLLEHQGRLLTKDELLAGVWHDAHVGDAVLKVTISQIRKTFRECPGLEIATTHGRGYMVRLDDCAGGTADDSAMGQHRALAGRLGELAALQSAFEKAANGHRQIVFLSGEAGIGKSAVVDTFTRQIERRPGRVLVGRGYCPPVAGTAEPLRPALSALATIQRQRPDPALAALLTRLAPHLLDEMDTTVSAAPVHADSMLEAAAAEIERLAAQQVVILHVEDVQWSDPQTCALLALLFQRESPCRLLVVVTHRNALSRDNEPLASLIRELAVARPACSAVMRLGPLDEAEVARIVRSDLGDAPETLTRFLAERSGGNPLFLDRLLVHLQVSGVLRREHAAWHFDEHAVRDAGIPRELDVFVASQIDQLDPSGRRVLQAASVAGTTFVAQDVAAILGLTVEHVEGVCDELATRHQLLDMTGVRSRADGIVGTEYQFRHPLLQNVLYDRLSAPSRKAFHARLASQLEASYGDLALLNAHELAEHFERSGNAERSLYWLRVAAHTAVERGMPADAREYLAKLMRMLESAPDTTGRFDAATDLARMLVIYSGPGVETSAAIERALELQSTGTSSGVQLLTDEQPTFLLLAMHVVEGDFVKVDDVARRLLAMRPGDPASETRVALGLAHYGRHRPAEAIDELERALAEARPAHRLTMDYVMLASAVLALACLQSGRLAKSCEHYDVALARARGSEAPINHAVGLGLLTEVHLLRGEWDWASHLAEATEAVSVRHDLRSFVGQARFVRGLAAFESGRYDDGLAQMADSIESCRATAHGLGLPYLHALFGRAQASRGSTTAGRTSMDEAMETVARTGESRFEPEILRIRAALLGRSRKRQDREQALRDLRAAADCARAQGSHLFSLRAAIDLATLAKSDSERAAARSELAAARAAIEPGSHCRELRAASDLLQQLDEAGRRPAPAHG